jgi:hypothetical protein
MHRGGGKILAATVWLAACGEGGPALDNEIYGANGVAAPAVYAIAPQAPRSLGSPAIAIANQPVATPPVLPPLDTPSGENPKFPERGCANRWA